MKLSLGTNLERLDNISGANGYGYATNCMVDSLQRLGYQIEANDASADVEIWFNQPHHWDFSPGTYKIGYHPWESTLLRDGWVDIMNECDEIWTPSPLIAHWYRRFSGITVPIYVYQHGVEHSWEPVRREPEDTIKFLHVGAEAARKGGWDTVAAFRRAFPHRTDVSLTMKMVNSRWLGLPSLGKVRYIDEKYDFPTLQKLFYDHHAYVYPSWGEGFGLTPLQAMATGMPTSTVSAWAPYSEFLDPELSLRSRVMPTRWPKTHPGKMLEPSMDDLIDAMRYIADNYEGASAFAMSQTNDIHKVYDWDTITQETFSALEGRLNH